MKATAIEFRLRFLIHCVIFTLGFWAPWNRWVHLDSTGANSHLWGLLAALLAKTGVVPIDRAFPAVLIVGIACAVAGAWLRTWGTAYIGSGIVQDNAMHGAAIVADGPYRHMRNPLYVGTFVATLALVLLMPLSGAVWTVLAIGIFQLRLMLAEEPFLTERLGASYTAYKALVPRIVPSIKAKVAASGQRPRWAQAVLGEILFWGIAGTYAVLGWQYNAFILMKGVVISLGVSLVARALVKT